MTERGSGERKRAGKKDRMRKVVIERKMEREGDIGEKR